MRLIRADTERCRPHDTFENSADSAVPLKMKQLIVAAVARVTRLPFGIGSHTKAALRQGVTREELTEAIWATAQMRADGSYAHSLLAIDEMVRGRGQDGGKSG